MKFLHAFTILLLCTFGFAMAQESSDLGVTLRDVDFHYTSETIEVRYKLHYDAPKTVTGVWVNFYNAYDQLLNARSLSGDTGLVAPGMHRIKWNYRRDNADLQDVRMYARVNVDVKRRISNVGAFAKSTLVPGWAQMNIARENKEKSGAWLWSVLNFGLAGASAYFKMESDAAYNKYMEAGDTQAADDFYAKANAYNKYFYSAAGAGVTLWTINIYDALKKNKRSIDDLPSSGNEYEATPDVQAETPVKKVRSSKTLIPPYLVLEKGSLRFTDKNNNRRIDAKEDCVIEFKVKNTGKGTAQSVYAEIEEENAVKGLQFPVEKSMGEIAPGGEKSLNISLNGTRQLEDDTAKFRIKIHEANGFGADPVTMQMETHAFRPPRVIVADYKFSSSQGNQIKPGIPIELKTLVQNVGKRKARDVKLQFNTPANIYQTAGSDFTIGTLEPGASKTIDYTFFTNKQYKDSLIRLEASLNESLGKYAEDKSITVPLHHELANTEVVLQANESSEGPVKQKSLRVKTDKNIPGNPGTYPNRYALVIGNQNYTKYQSRLTSESNVDFARNDALVFAEYAHKTLGIPKQNITLVTNAIASKMKRELDRLIVKPKFADSVELFFYYSGHGFYDDQHRSYIMPVDVSSSSVTSGIALHDLYRQITRHNPERATLFLDACFSGGGREAGLLSAKGVRIKPKESKIYEGNLVVFSASSGEQESLFHKDYQHGLFTYFLLDKLQQTAGKVTYGELYRYVRKKVGFAASDKKYREQTPEVNTSRKLGAQWKTWKLYSKPDNE